MRIYVAGIGPGSAEDITPAVSSALADSDIIVGYKYYFQFITSYLRPDAVCIDTGMKKEQERAKTALEYALNGHPAAMRAYTVWHPYCVKWLVKPVRMLK